MAKPIFIIHLPHTASKEMCDFVCKQTKNLGDYYVVISQSKSAIEPTYQVFYEKDFNEVKFEELKQIVKDSLK